MVLGALAFFLFLTLGVRHDTEQRKLFYLYVVIDLWLVGVVLFLLVTAVLN